MPIEHARDYHRRHAAEEIKTRWMYQFAAAIEERYEGFTKDGLWTAAHMYHGMGLTVNEAVNRFGRDGRKVNEKQLTVT